MTEEKPNVKLSSGGADGMGETKSWGDLIGWFKKKFGKNKE